MTDRRLRVGARRGSLLRCAYCHAALGERSRRCGSCDSVLHVDCWVVARACPTLGCSSGVRIKIHARARRRRVWGVALVVMLAWVGVPWRDVLGWLQERPTALLSDPLLGAQDIEALQRAASLRDEALPRYRAWKEALAAGDKTLATVNSRDALRRLQEAMQLVLTLGQVAPPGADVVRADLAALIDELLRAEWAAFTNDWTALEIVRGSETTTWSTVLGPIRLDRDPVITELPMKLSGDRAALPMSASLEVPRWLMSGHSVRFWFNPEGISFAPPAFEWRVFGLIGRETTISDVLAVFGRPTRALSDDDRELPNKLTYVRGPFTVDLEFHRRGHGRLIAVSIARKPPH